MLSLPSLPPRDLHRLWYTTYSCSNGFDDGPSVGENASASGYIGSAGIYSSRRHHHASNGDPLWTSRGEYSHNNNMMFNRHVMGDGDSDEADENLPITGSLNSQSNRSPSYYSAGNRVISGGSIVGSSIFGSDGANIISAPSLAVHDEDDDEDEYEDGGENNTRHTTTTTGLGPVEGKVCKCPLDCDEVDYRHFLESVQTFGYNFLRPRGIERTIAAAHEQLDESDEGSYETNELEFSGGENSVESGVEDDEILRDQDDENEETGIVQSPIANTTTANDYADPEADDGDDDDDENDNQVDLDDLIAEGDDFNGSFYDTSESEHSFVEDPSDDRQQQENAQTSLEEQGYSSSSFGLETFNEHPQTPQNQQAAPQPPIITRLSTTTTNAIGNANYRVLNANLSLSISESDVSLEQSVLQYPSRGATRSVSLEEPISPRVAVQQERGESSLGDFITDVSMSDDMSFDDD